MSAEIVSWRGLGVAFGSIVVTAVLSVGVVSVLMPRLPKLFAWETHRWADWPEVIPPTGWLAAGLLALLVLGLCLGSYVLFQRWSGRANFSLVGLLPFSLAALVLAFAEPAPLMHSSGRH